ncbi:MAG: phosphonate C-P lyase system protein PhnG [Clostridia bacterium]|nr:phosphonate C-P lyase system protein PhnG [Clostridia bacterium]
MHYSQVIAEGRIEKLRDIADTIVNHVPCRIISNPSPGMVMVKHTDPLEKTPFYLGEAFVTQCEAEVDGCMGYGCVLGDEPERAVFGAIIDAVLGNKNRMAPSVNPMIEEEARFIKDQWTRESRQISKTKVNFDVKKG